jgi:hypothetical protein
LNDLGRNPEEYNDFYGSEVRLRLIMDLIEPMMDPPDETYINLLNELDIFLRRILIPGAFIWDAVFVPGFEQDTYWYLWGKPGIGNSHIS